MFFLYDTIHLMESKFIVVALGGSLIVPHSGKINVIFLKKFRGFILRFVKRGRKFIIIAGGGKTARSYQQAAAQIGKLSFEDMDWLGIHSTRLNAHLLRTIFRKWAHPVIIDNPHKRIRDIQRYPLIIASGWKPGWSTDYIAVLLAKRFRLKKILDAGNIPYVFTADHRKHKKGAKPIFKMTWNAYKKLVGSRWRPGMSSPIDPVAAKKAHRENIEAIIFLGTDLRNFRNILEGKKFRGTIIRNVV